MNRHERSLYEMAGHLGGLEAALKMILATMLAGYARDGTGYDQAVLAAEMMREACLDVTAKIKASPAYASLPEVGTILAEEMDGAINRIFGQTSDELRRVADLVLELKATTTLTKQ